MSEVEGAPRQAERRLRELGLQLPAPLVMPSPNRINAVLTGRLLFVSGHGAPAEDTTIKTHGKVGADLTQEEGYAVARAIGMKMLATVRAAIGDLDRVARVVKVVGMVNSDPSFEHVNLVINGASDLFYEVFGEVIGRHARSTFGVAVLVGNHPVEIEGVFEVDVN